MDSCSFAFEMWLGSCQNYGIMDTPCHLFTNLDIDCVCDSGLQDNVWKDGVEAGKFVTFTDSQLSYVLVNV
jgi:hypothetical protein